MSSTKDRSREPTMPRIEVAEGDWVGGWGGYYADDLIAIQGGAVRDGLIYRGRPVSPGHVNVRNPARVVMVRLLSSDGQAAWGDVVATQYSGIANRDLPIDPSSLAPQLSYAIDSLRRAGPLTFLDACAQLETTMFEGHPLHTGIRYGLSQALLQLAAQSTNCLPLEILWGASDGITLPNIIPVYAQSGEDRYSNVDKMILKRVDVLPHGLINSMEVFGTDGRAFLEYAGWVHDRVLQEGEEGYQPLLHFDIYGLLGHMSGNDPARMAGFCAELEARCAPLNVQLESPAYGNSVESTAEVLCALREQLRVAGVHVRIVADEWCNTLEDISSFAQQGAVDMIQIKTPDLGSISNVLSAATICQEYGTAVFIGGSCTETDTSARLSAQLAIAVGADQVLAKPGMGVDEGLLIIRNEMTRTLHTLKKPLSPAGGVAL